jgi:antirestriction protein ArdC
MIRVAENKRNVNERQAEALSRALTGQSWSNFPAIIQGFTARGIPENEIMPRENVFTYQAWKALGRQVRKGEHGVKVITFIKRDKKVKDTETDEVKIKTYSMPRTVSVFHISQTDAKEGVQNAAI